MTYPTEDTERDLVLTRIINAPPEKVYRCWTEPELLKQWFAPRPWNTPSVEADVRPGGASRVTMADESGTEYVGGSLRRSRSSMPFCCSMTLATGGPATPPSRATGTPKTRSPTSRWGSMKDGDFVLRNSRKLPDSYRANCRPFHALTRIGINPTAEDSMNPDQDDRIRDRAYALWEAAGSPEGDDQRFWHQAERELAEEGSVDVSAEQSEEGKPVVQAGFAAH